MAPEQKCVYCSFETGIREIMRGHVRRAHPGHPLIEPDLGPRTTTHHKKIVSVTPIPGTISGNICHLECGHVVQTFGSLSHAQGVVLCTECRDQEERSITCPKCGKTSYHPKDVEEGYCGFCHAFTRPL
jgi:ribosomal protein L37E